MNAPDAIATVARAFRVAAEQDADRGWHADYSRREAGNHAELAVTLSMLLDMPTSKHVQDDARRLLAQYRALRAELWDRVEGKAK